MKDFWWRFALIGGCTLLGFLSLWPPEKKLKLGIDLSGGTILVYEVDTDPSVRAQHGRADLGAEAPGRPRGRQGNPDPPDRLHRIEIILPQASNEEVEEVKKMLVDVGALEFRILANRKHDGDVIRAGALGPAGLAKPPSRYNWARLGEISTGNNPTLRGDALEDPKQSWKNDIYAGIDIVLTGKDATGKDADRSRARQAERPRPPDARPTHVAQDGRIRTGSSTTPAGSAAGTRTTRRPRTSFIREEKVAPGRIEPLHPLQHRSRGPGGHRQVPPPGAAGLRRAAPAGRRLRVRPPRRGAVRQADPRPPARGRGRVQVSARDPARQPRDVGAVDQLRDPRLGDHRGRAARGSRRRRSST